MHQIALGHLREGKRNLVFIGLQKEGRIPNLAENEEGRIHLFAHEFGSLYLAKEEKAGPDEQTGHEQKKASNQMKVMFGDGDHERR